MADFFDRWLRGRQPGQPPDEAEPLTEERIITGYRMYWTRIALSWDGARRAAVAARVQAVIADDRFERNLLERRYRVEDLDDQAHSGASLLALVEVIHALDKFDVNNDNQD